jgi:steroid 5-alpha reductase family enzyme
VLWLVSLPLRNSSIVDVFWGPLFAVVATWSFFAAGASGTRAWLVLVLVWVWALRLAVHLGLRVFGHDEDRRYAAIRERHGGAWWWRSLFIVFVFQGVLAWVISFPLQAVMWLSPVAGLSIVDGLGAVLIVLGLTIETVADLQLTQFRSEPENQGRVLDRGLWRYSRHPNYFGDAVVWCGFGCIGLSTGAVWTLVGPALMTWLLLRVSGVTLLEETIVERRPEYVRYQRTTPAFFPGRPRHDPSETSA